MIKSKTLLIISIISTITILSCTPKPDQLIEMVSPIVYQIAKVTDKYNRHDGKAIINLEYENIRFRKSHFPSGEMTVTASSSYLGKKKYTMKFKFNGSYKASCTVIYPNNRKEYQEVNLATSSIIKGETLTLNRHLNTLTCKMVKDNKKFNKEKIAVFQFPMLDGKYTLLGDYISENIITVLCDKNIKVVERGLLKNLFKEFNMQQTGIVEYGKKEIEKVTELTGATAIITGTISVINDDIVINSRIISRNGEIISTGKEVVKKYLVPSSYFKIKNKRTY